MIPITEINNAIPPINWTATLSITNIITGIIKPRITIIKDSMVTYKLYLKSCLTLFLPQFAKLNRVYFLLFKTSSTPPIKAPIAQLRKNNIRPIPKTITIKNATATIII